VVTKRAKLTPRHAVMKKILRRSPNLNRPA
jgi:hypothetical protein